MGRLNNAGLCEWVLVVTFSDNMLRINGRWGGTYGGKLTFCDVLN